MIYVSLCFSGCRRSEPSSFPPPVNRFHKRVGSEPARPFPRFKPSVFTRDEVATKHHFIPFHTPKAFRNAGSRECLRPTLLLRWFGCAVRHAFTVSRRRITIQFHGVICFGFVWCVTRRGLRQMALLSATSTSSGIGASGPPSPSNRDKSSDSTGVSASAAGRMKGPSTGRFFISFVFMARGFIDWFAFDRPERWSTGWKRR